MSPPSLYAKAGLFIAKTGLSAMFLVALAGDVAVNPGPTPYVGMDNLSVSTNEDDSGSDLDSVFTDPINLSQCSINSEDDVYCDPYPFFNLGLGEKGLRFGHWNINRLSNSKFDQIKLFLLGSDKRPQIDILSLNETFLKPSIPDSVFSVPGFTIYRRERNGKNGGGVLMFVNDELNHRRRTDLEDPELEH
jgi:hypothetical protein